VIVNFLGNPGHPLKEGVTVIVDVIFEEVVFKVINDGIFPVPDAAIPVT